MEYEKPPTAPAFSRKLRNRSHSLSFSANVVYDGVFASPATKKPSPAVDYGEIFRGTGPSPSSIPFLDVPELNEEKVKVDVRSSKLDYSSVFGGFEGCDFAISPDELIIRSERKTAGEKDKRNRKKAGNSSDVPPSSKAKNHISSPEVVSMKQFNVPYHSTVPHDGNGINGTTQVAQVHSVSGYTRLVDNPCPLLNMENGTHISKVEKEPCNRGPVKVTDCNEVLVDIPSSNGSRKQSSKNEPEFENIFDRNGSNIGDNFANSVRKTDLYIKHPDVKPPSSLQHNIHGDGEASERSMGPKSGGSEGCRSEDANSACSPPYFDEETGANSAAAAAALKKAIEEAQLKINIAKHMMERKKAGFRSRAKSRSSDSRKGEDKGNTKFEQQTEKCRDNETKNVGEVTNSSGQPFPNTGEQILGELVNSSKQSFPNAGTQSVGGVVISSEQSFLNKGEQNVGEVVNSSKQSFRKAGEQILGEMVNTSKQSFPNAGERIVGGVVLASEQSFLNKGDQNVGELVSTSEQSIPNEGEHNVGGLLTSSEISFPNEGERNIGEVVNSSEQSIPNEGELILGKAVNSSEQSILNEGELTLGEAVNSSEQSIPNEGERHVGEAVNSSKQSSPDQGEQQVKRARRLWEVPGGLLKSTLHHMQDEAGEREMIRLEEEHARRARKHWEIPGGIFKSVVNSKQHETENPEAAEHATDTNREIQKVTENSFYSFEQLGNKIKCVVEAFTGSKVAQKSEAEGIEHVIIESHENSSLTHEVLDQEGEEKIVFEREDILVGSSDREICEREVGEILKPADSQSTTQVDDNADSTMCYLAEECLQKEEKETGWHRNSQNASESHDAHLPGVHDTHDNYNNDTHDSYDIVHENLDQEVEESLSEPQEMLVGPADTKTYEREAEEIRGPTQSMSNTQIYENAGSMVSILTENASVSGNAPEGNEKEHKTPRRRRVWKTSEDVYGMIKGLKRYNRAWQLEDGEKEMMKRCLREQSARVDDAIDGEETDSISELPTDSGLQENWNSVKQMFRQMFQTVETNKREDETSCLVESEQNQIEIHQRAEGVYRKGTAETSNYELTGANILNDAYKQDKMETVSLGYDAYVHTRENDDAELTLKMYSNKEDGEVTNQNKSSFVYELIRDELEATEVTNKNDVEDVAEVSEADDVDLGAFEFDEIKEQPDSRADILEHDKSETHSSNSDETFEQKPCEELAENTKIGGSIDDDMRGPSFVSGQANSDAEQVDIEQEVYYDQRPEKTSSTSSTGEQVEELDSESNKSGYDVADMEFISKRNENDDNLKSFLEESLAGSAQDAGASQPPYKPEEVEAIREQFVDNEGNPDSESPDESDSRSSMEAAELLSCLCKGDEKSAAVERSMKESDGEYRCQSSINEERGATTDASQNEAEPLDVHLKKIDKAKEKEKEREKERIMVDRAIREARERAFADARERAGRAAMEKANAGAHRRTSSEVRGRSEKAYVEANDKLSSAERASMQAKLRAERAAVERALSEARERALEKALSGKAASQARSQGGKSSGPSVERRGFSSSSTENRSSAPPTSSNQSNGEPVQRCRARSERHQRTAERAAKALAEKKLRDLIAQKEQVERNRLAETLDTEVKRWSSGKEGNLRALLSTLQYILGPESGWKPIHLTDLVSSAAVRKAYRKATLYVHPDKLQQRGAATQQKYICEKVFDLLKDAWNKFSAEER